MRKTLIGWAIATTVAGCGGESIVGGLDPGSNATDEEGLGTAVAALTVPTSYSAVAGRSGGGVNCYRRARSARSRACGAPSRTASEPAATDYVCVADLRTARVGTSGGAVAGPAGERTHYRSPLRTLATSGTAPGGGNFRAVVAANASFFATSDNPAGMSFPYKRASVVLNGGFESGSSRWTGQLRILSMWWDRRYAAIGPYSTADRAGLSAWGSAPDIIGSLSSTADKGFCNARPRTYVGVNDRDGDGLRESLLLYVSTGATQQTAIDELGSFGASELIQLDGGSSTGLVIDGSQLVAPSYSLPNAIVLYAAQ